MKTIFFIFLSCLYLQLAQANCTTSSEELFNIVTNGSANNLKIQIESGCSYKIANNDGDSLFAVARRLSKNETLSYLCGLSNEPFICSGFNNNLNGDLQKAVVLKDYYQINELLKSGANPDGNHIQNNLHDSNITDFPLLTAVKQKDYKTINLLLKYGAQVNLSSGYSNFYSNTMNSPIMSTVFTNDIEMANFLISKNINLYSNENKFNDPVGWIAELIDDRSEYLNFLLHNAKADEKKSIILKVLSLMWNSNVIREKYFNILLKNIPDTEIQNQDDNPITYVQAALNLKSYSALKLVLGRGAPVNIPSSKCNTGWGSNGCIVNETLLPIASVVGLGLDESFLNLLIQHNAKLNPVFTNRKINLLSYLIYRNYPQNVINSFINLGAKIDDEVNPLIALAKDFRNRFSDNGLLRLIQAGAPVNISSEPRTAPLLNTLFISYFDEESSVDDSIELFKALIKSGYDFNANHNGNNSFSSYMQFYPRLKRPLPFKVFAPIMIEQGGASLVSTNSCTNSMLEAPIEDRNYVGIDSDDFMYLISKGADLLSKCNGYSFIYNFIKKNRSNKNSIIIFELLLNNKSVVDEINNYDGKSNLYLAAFDNSFSENNTNQTIKIFNLLAKYKVNPNNLIKDSLGKRFTIYSWIKNAWVPSHALESQKARLLDNLKSLGAHE